MSYKLLILSTVLTFWVLPVRAQDGAPSGIGVDEAEPSPSPSPDPDKLEIEIDENGFVDPVVYTERQKQKTCQKYQGQFVNHYGSVYKVEKCKLREILSQDMLFELTRKKVKFTLIDSGGMAQLERGEAITDQNTGPARGCKQLEKRYITFDHDLFYRVEGCKKRLFPDFESFSVHRRELKLKRQPVLALTAEEFAKLPDGKPFPSEVDAEIKRASIKEKPIDVIPIDEACKGLNGKDVSFVDLIYHIERCRKRPYDAQAYTKKYRSKNYKLVELTSEQWLSLPDGKPMTLK